MPHSTTDQERRGIDWDFWEQMPTVELRDAVALSVYINPDNLRAKEGDLQIYLDAIRMEFHAEVFRKRLELAKAHAANGTLQAKYDDEAKAFCVSLSAFAHWAQSMGLFRLPPMPDELISLAEPISQPRPTCMLETTPWNEVTIRFLSDDYLEIKAPEFIQRYTFADCGLKNLVTKEPNRIGKFLMKLADNQGSTRGAKLNQKDRNNLKGRVKDTRKVLRNITGIKEDPFHRYNQKDGYKLKCTLVNAAPSYNEEDTSKTTWEQYHD